MILPIVAYGDPVLKKRAENISPDYPGLKKLIEDMFETMYNSKGVGLAAPQIGKSIRLFIVDASPFEEEEPDLIDFVQVFINPVIIEESGKDWDFSEGCLSIPSIREDVNRKERLVIQYQDENFETWEEEFDGIAARIIQHEYDHIEGKLFVERLNPLRRRMLKNRLLEISKGNVDVEYKMKFYVK
jgi:peptide deformylase